MHQLAKNFALQIEKKVTGDIAKSFGRVMRYRDIYFGKMKDGEVVSVEELVSGEFSKYINNDGLPCSEQDEDLVQKAGCLTHYSYIKSEKQVMVVDVQGVGCDLFDPEIASSLLVDNDEVMFAAGNLSQQAIDNFI